MTPADFVARMYRPPSQARGTTRTEVTLTFVVVLAILSSVGCTTGPREWVRNRFKVGPNYQHPAAPVATAFIDSDRDKELAGPVQDHAWWAAFNDPTLNCLIETSYRQNLDLRAAGARILEARSQRNIAVGNLFPQSQSALGVYATGQITENLGVALPSSFDIWATGFNTSWEMDFWGRYRRSLESANANWASRVEQYGETLVMLLSEVAATYVEIRTFEERLAFARRNVEIQRGSLALAEVRFREGASTELDVRQARTILAQTESAIPPLEAGHRQANNRLCILLGMPVKDIASGFAVAPIPTAPPQLAVGIPAELLRRRPDIRRAERLVAAQSAQIGVAAADMYPRFALNGFLGYAADDLERLFSPRSFTSFFIPTVQWNVLNYGRIANNVAVQDARLQTVALEYQQTVLKAGGQVEDALVAFIKAHQQAATLAGSVQDAERSVELVLVQFREGAVDFNRVYNTQGALVTQQDQLAQARGQIAVSMIQAYKALGGGWQHFFGGRGLPVAAQVEISTVPADQAEPLSEVQMLPTVEDIPTPESLPARL